MKNKKRKAVIFLISFCVAILLACTVSIFISYYALAVTEYRISTDKTSDDISVVMLSDLHDSEFGEGNKKLLEKVKGCKPDLILVVGDMLSYYTEDYGYLKKLYADLSDIAPTYCSLGNHETAHEDSEEIIKIMSTYSDGLLNAEYLDLTVKGNNIRLGGLSVYGYNDKASNDFVAQFADTDRFKILMYHQPEYYLWGIKKYDVDLSLSGHTHGGQVILPFAGGAYAPEQGWWPEYDYGYFEGENGDIIITRGLGSSKQPAPRFNNPPEILHITISAEK